MEKAKIRITRGKDYFGMVRKLKVFIDKKHAGGVKWNKSEEFPVSPGMHYIQVKMDWCKSVPVTPRLKEGELVEYVVITPAKGSLVGIFKQLYDLVFNFSEFFELRKVNRPTENIENSNN